jgi:hypothetical protein
MLVLFQLMLVLQAGVPIGQKRARGALLRDA